MNDTITQDGTPVPADDDNQSCGYEHVGPDFDGSTVSIPCGAVPTHRPILDDLYSQHLRATGVADPDVQPHELPLCDDHYAQLHVDIAQQEQDDQYRIWIVAEPTTIVIGYTKNSSDLSYVPAMDGWRPDAPQHLLAVTVPLPPGLAPHEVAELVFIGTNAPQLETGSPEYRIHHAIRDTGYRGQEAHWALSVGDTVTVDGIRLQVKPAGWDNA